MNNMNTEVASGICRQVMRNTWKRRNDNSFAIIVIEFLFRKNDNYTIANTLARITKQKRPNRLRPIVKCLFKAKFSLHFSESVKANVAITI